MKHNKIFSSEVVHKGKTLDRVLESSGGGDIEIIEAELVDNDGAIPGTNDYAYDSLTYMPNNTYKYSISTQTAAKILRAIYENKPVKIVYPFYKYFYDTSGRYYNPGVPPTSFVSVIVNNFVVTDKTTYQAQFKILNIIACGIFCGANSPLGTILNIQLTVTGFQGRQQEAFELAGLTIEDFYRKFLPDNPYFPAE